MHVWCSVLVPHAGLVRGANGWGGKVNTRLLRSVGRWTRAQLSARVVSASTTAYSAPGDLH